VVPLVVWASAGQTTLGWVLVAAAITPIADGLIVLTNGGTASKALGIHGVTAGPARRGRPRARPRLTRSAAIVHNRTKSSA
jgi:hypothetical protein